MSEAEKDFQAFICIGSAPTLAFVLGFTIFTGSMASFALFVVMAAGFLRLARMIMTPSGVHLFYVDVPAPPALIASHQDREG